MPDGTQQQIIILGSTQLKKQKKLMLLWAPEHQIWTVEGGTENTGALNLNRYKCVEF